MSDFFISDTISDSDSSSESSLNSSLDSDAGEDEEAAIPEEKGAGWMKKVALLMILMIRLLLMKTMEMIQTSLPRLTQLRPKLVIQIIIGPHGMEIDCSLQNYVFDRLYVKDIIRICSF